MCVCSQYNSHENILFESLQVLYITNLFNVHVPNISTRIA